jgi:endonuclease-3
LGLTRQQDPVKIEKDLAQILPPKEWTNFSHRLIIHGRRVCVARKPACQRCALIELCPSGKIPSMAPVKLSGTHLTAGQTF